MRLDVDIREIEYWLSDELGEIFVAPDESEEIREIARGIVRFGDAMLDAARAEIQRTSDLGEFNKRCWERALGALCGRYAIQPSGVVYCRICGKPTGSEMTVCGPCDKKYSTRASDW